MLPAALVGVEPGGRQRAGEGRLSWPVLLLTLAAVTTSSLSALSLYQLVALRAEVDALKSEVGRRREEGQGARHGGQVRDDYFLHNLTLMTISQPCLQLLANMSRVTFTKALTSGLHTGIPWQSGLRRGSALEVDGDSILVREEGFYFVYSQVYYMDSTFAMGHVVIRRKRTVVGDESPDVILFRCIQNMNPVYPYNTCYTGGIVKLKVGDHLELLIPRPTANVSLEGDSTFLGAVKLA
uniref:THD domain-containing protein n=1 Tax=Mola mola TaxID=94237 RepID=A0A3Q4BWD7_MOLML